MFTKWGSKLSGFSTHTHTHTHTHTQTKDILWQVGSQDSVGVLLEVLLEEIRQLEQRGTGGKGGTLDQAFLVEDKEVSGTGHDHSAPIIGWLGDATRLEVRQKLVQ